MKNGRTRLIIISAVVLILAIVLLIWALRGVPLKDVVKILGALQAWQIAVILLVNSGIIFLFALRWWLILRAQGKAPPYVSLVRYRLAAFSMLLHSRPAVRGRALASPLFAQPSSNREQHSHGFRGP